MKPIPFNLNVSGGSLKWHLSDSGNNDRLGDLHFSQSVLEGDWSRGSMSVCVGGVWSAGYDGSYTHNRHIIATKALISLIIYPHNKDKMGEIKHSHIMHRCHIWFWLLIKKSLHMM